MKSKVIEHEIVAMRAEMVQLKGKLAWSKNLEQAGSDKTGEGTNKQRQKRDATWKKVPPKENEPTTKKIGKKDFHWCEHHMAWTIHHPKDCKLKDATAKPGDTTAPPTNVTTVAATFSAKSIVNLIRSPMGLSADLDY